MSVPAPNEQALVKQVLDYLTLRGVLCWRQNAGGAKLGRQFVRFTSLDGVSDVLGVLPRGRFLACELKSRRGTLRPSQEAFLARVEAAGGLAVVARSLDEVRRAVDPILDGGDQ